MFTSRERLLRCIRHEPLDRVPISAFELVGWNDSAWENNEPSYKRLMDAIREYGDCIYMLEPEFRVKQNSFLNIRKWTIDKSHFTEKTYHTAKGDLVSLHRYDEGLYTTWVLKHLLEDISDIDMYLSLPYTPPDIDMTRFYREQDKLGDRGIMMITLYDPVCLAAELFEMGAFLVHAATEQGKIKYFLDAIHERQMFDLRRILKHGVKDVMFRIAGPEYISPPYLSPGYFYNYSTCYLIRICREIREAGGIPRIHSHGRIGKIVEQFAMTDAQAIDPIEPPPDGDVELGDIKRSYGSKFCLFGNIELRELEHSDRARIDFLVKRAMDDAKCGSGFVLMPTSAPINVPLSLKTEENYLQLFESAHRYGAYQT